MKVFVLLCTLGLLVNCFAGDDDVSTIEYQKILSMSQYRLPAKTRHESLADAYQKLHERLQQSFNPTYQNERPVFPQVVLLEKIFENENIFLRDRINIIHKEYRKKILLIGLTILKFVGWSHHAKGLMIEFNRTYENYLNVINLIKPYFTTESDKITIQIIQIRLRRFQYESTKAPQRNNQDFWGEIDCNADIRKEMYDTLNTLKNDVNTNLVEQADLILTCGYSPSANPLTDNEIAFDLLQEYFKSVSHTSKKIGPLHPPILQSLSIGEMDNAKTTNDQFLSVRQRAQSLLDELKAELQRQRLSDNQADDHISQDDDESFSFSSAHSSGYNGDLDDNGDKLNSSSHDQSDDEFEFDFDEKLGYFKNTCIIQNISSSSSDINTSQISILSAKSTKPFIVDTQLIEEGQPKKRLKQQHRKTNKRLEN